MSKLSKEIKEYISCPQINGKPYGRWGTLNSQQRIKIWNLAHQSEVFESVADDSVKKLAKYKRAFEILKEVLEIPEDDDIDWCDKDINYYKLKFTKRLINGNEKELLEELMKSE